MVLKGFKSSERSSTSKQLVRELGLVRLAVGVNGVVGFVRFTFNVSVSYHQDQEGIDTHPNRKAF
jgi:hypothetical protein